MRFINCCCLSWFLWKKSRPNLVYHVFSPENTWNEWWSLQQKNNMHICNFPQVADSIVHWAWIIHKWYKTSINSSEAPCPFHPLSYGTYFLQWSSRRSSGSHGDVNAWGLLLLLLLLQTEEMFKTIENLLLRSMLLLVGLIGIYPTHQSWDFSTKINISQNDEYHKNVSPSKSNWKRSHLFLSHRISEKTAKTTKLADIKSLPKNWAHGCTWHIPHNISILPTKCGLFNGP